MVIFWESVLMEIGELAKCKKRICKSQRGLTPCVLCSESSHFIFNVLRETRSHCSSSVTTLLKVPVITFRGVTLKSIFVMWRSGGKAQVTQWRGCYDDICEYRRLEATSSSSEFIKKPGKVWPCDKRSSFFCNPSTMFYAAFRLS